MVSVGNSSEAPVTVISSVVDGDGVAWRARMNSTGDGVTWRARIQPAGSVDDERRVVLIVDVGDCDCNSVDSESLATRVVPVNDGMRVILIVGVGDAVDSESLATRVVPVDNGMRAILIVDVGDDDDDS